MCVAARCCSLLAVVCCAMSVECGLSVVVVCCLLFVAYCCCCSECALPIVCLILLWLVVCVLSAGLWLS